MVIVAIVALFLFILFAIAVTTLKSSTLATFISFIIVLQQLVTIGRTASQQLPDNGIYLSIRTVFAAAAIINLESAILKPGCSIGEVDLLELFWSALGIVAFAVILFIIGSSIRATVLLNIYSDQAKSLKYRVRTEMKTSIPPVQFRNWKFLFFSRLLHSILILSSFVYLRICMFAISAVNCQTIKVDESNSDDSTERTRGIQSNTYKETTVLKADTSVICYENNHAKFAFVIWLILFGFCGGFPLVSLILLKLNETRNKNKSKQIHPVINSENRSAAELGLDLPAEILIDENFNYERMEKYGYLYRSVRNEVW